jgi:mannosyl-oligosaccharide alpha-1,2-mannosidase
LVVAVIVTFSLYHLTRIRRWDGQTIGIDKLRKFGHPTTSTSQPRLSPSTSYARPVDIAEPTERPKTSLRRQSSQTPTATQPSTTLLDFPEPLTSSQALQSSEYAQATAPSNDRLPVPETERLSDEEDISEDFESQGQGRFEIDQQSAILEKPHWIPQKEHFPVPSSSLIQIPSGKPKQIPAIQHVFNTEPLSAKKNNEQRRRAVKEAFEHAWSGYKEFAMPHDELSPVSKDFRDPFNGWGATLVDSLDTLWIMDLKDDFVEAVAEVKKIDFKTSIRKDIPLFETVIRYLGGLIAAHDLSSERYPVLLEKAEELAEILMGAFDTPNRMPVTYYNWAPSYASQPHRAASRVVLAELGSLSLEFTRLAQITRETKYYDAIARITNELQAWQNNTKLPGLWPVSVDASGCKKPDRLSLQMAHSTSNGPQNILPPIQNSPNLVVDETEPDSHEQDNDIIRSSTSNPLDKRQLDDAGISDGEEPALLPSDQIVDDSGSSSASTGLPQNSKTTMDGVDCLPHGLTSPAFVNLESFTLGGMADSTYEYLPKEWLLLGGLNDQYESMYKEAMNGVRDNLLYRPMTLTGRDVLFAGTMRTNGRSENEDEVKFPGSGLEYEAQHLTCFAGGMFALGAKIFDMKDDLEIARKLTNGCVWAYGSTTTGIMPESFQLAPCHDLTKCTWNETKWWEALDPYRNIREEQARTWYEHQQLLGLASPQEEVDQPVRPQYPDMPVIPADNAESDLEDDSIENGTNNPKAVSDSAIQKRQVSDLDDTLKADDEAPMQPTQAQPAPAEYIASNKNIEENTNSAAPNSSTQFFTPKSPPSHSEFVRARIQEERLPPGFTSITSRKYILRPEAIESVFIMYRVTGEQYWRDVGWDMFTAIQSATFTQHGNSAITDVTSEVPLLADEMESFWLAETLKYFYLLYSDEGLVSLDDYVL